LWGKKKGSGKYKGKLLFKCFNCGKLGIFFDKCPYEKDENNDVEEDHNVNKGRKHHRPKNNHKQDKHENKKNFYKQKKILFSKGVSEFPEESSERNFDSDRKETLLMEIRTKIDDDKGK